MAFRVACQALPGYSTQGHATNIPALSMTPRKAYLPRDVAVLASGSPFTSAQREPGTFWRPDCPPDEADEVRRVPFSMWPRKVAAKKAERSQWIPDSRRSTFRSGIEEVNYLNSRIQFKIEDEEEESALKRFNPLKLLGL